MCHLPFSTELHQVFSSLMQECHEIQLLQIAQRVYSSTKYETSHSCTQHIYLFLTRTLGAVLTTFL